MAKDPRDILWEATWDSRYYAYYQELCFRTLIRRWTFVDRATKVAVGITSASSVIAGYAFWKEEGWRATWTVIAGSAALLSIVHSSLSVADTIRRHTEMLSKLVALRLDFEDLMRKMNMAPDFDLKKIETEYQHLRDRYKAVSSQPVSDLFFTTRLSKKAQDHLDALLSPTNEQKSKSTSPAAATSAADSAPAK